MEMEHVVENKVLWIGETNDRRSVATNKGVYTS